MGEMRANERRSGFPVILAMNSSRHGAHSGGADGPRSTLERRRMARFAFGCFASWKTSISPSQTTSPAWTSPTWRFRRGWPRRLQCGGSHRGGRGCRRGVGHWHACSVPTQSQKGTGPPSYCGPASVHSHPIMPAPTGQASQDGSPALQATPVPAPLGHAGAVPPPQSQTHVPPSNSQNMYCEHDCPLKPVITPDASPASGGG